MKQKQIFRVSLCFFLQIRYGKPEHIYFTVFMCITSLVVSLETLSSSLCYNADRQWENYKSSPVVNCENVELPKILS